MRPLGVFRGFMETLRLERGANALEVFEEQCGADESDKAADAERHI